jgi:hypothetical protein
VKLKSRFEQETQAKKDHLLPVIEGLKNSISKELEDIARGDRDILKQEEENSKLESLIQKQRSHIDKLNEDKT